MSLSAPPANMTTPVAAPTAPPPPPSAPSGMGGSAMASTETTSPPLQVVNNSNNTDTPNRASPGHSHDTLLCHWGDCQQQFENHVTLAAHLSEDHVGWKRPEYVCDWINCARRGVKCHSRFALMMHLRIHTGEKPFVCKHPGCDQAFGRQDALMRHKKAEHEPQDPKPVRKQQQPDIKTSPNKRRRMAAPITHHHHHHQHQQNYSHQHHHHHHYRRGSISDDEDSSLTQAQKYKLAKAKLRYILRENEILNDEWMSIQKKLRHLQTERRVLLEVLMGNNAGGTTTMTTAGGNNHHDPMDLSDGDDDGEDIDSQDSMLEDDEENH
ncbi:hypothetical protein RO3G_04366 [Lichtheimia corymbifera JMRC:FSU:9682]|uniref:C2H2-type domain-containing protein n=1 Tax=Lichtheimia corymbifera JMRC:FSU:9682 TaxID=1263082 RepID=A0A068RVC6_9FUNG|nr:hypothetical protein RO3G_04366 [Lichtheimia corymbifera JMRC:FSU:9682]